MNKSNLMNWAEIENLDGHVRGLGGAFGWIMGKAGEDLYGARACASRMSWSRTLVDLRLANNAELIRLRNEATRAEQRATR